MTHTENAASIVIGVACVLGAPFLLLGAESLATDNQTLMANIVPVGLAILLFCSLTLFTGMWLDG